MLILPPVALTLIVNLAALDDLLFWKSSSTVCATPVCPQSSTTTLTRLFDDKPLGSLQQYLPRKFSFASLILSDVSKERSLFYATVVILPPSARQSPRPGLKEPEYLASDLAPATPDSF